jgi:DNA (cytosine-5)-methyltransferase 1
LEDSIEANFAGLFIDGNEKNFDESAEEDQPNFIAIDDANYPPPANWQLPPQHWNPVHYGNPSTSPIRLRNESITDGGHLEVLPSYVYDGLTLKEGITVELKNGDFVRIKHIIFNKLISAKHSHVIRGYRFRRSKELPVPGRFLNEVVMCIDQYKNDSRPPNEQGLFETPVHEVVSKRTLIITSDAYPLHSYRDARHSSVQGEKSGEQDNGRKARVRETCHLVCRYVFTRIAKKTSRARTPQEGVLRRIRSDESDIFENSCHDDCVCHDKIDAEELAKGDITYGSGFCCGGGDIRGAKKAGAKFVFAFDKDPKAIATCRINNPESELAILNCDQHEILTQKIPIPRIHIYHLSYPCQDFSTINRRGEKSKNWGINSALITSVSDHLKKFRPLVHTQENTAALLTHYPNYFFHLISEITKCGYNVRWKVVNFQESGTSASRGRLLIMAARHDIPLPEFPPQKFRPPHSGPYHLPPYPTIHHALRGFNDKAPEHDTLKQYWASSKWQASYDPQKTYAQCVTTQGSKTPHPSGKRPFIYPELARLQGFDDNYVWVGTKTEIRKQIGNAVPPPVMEGVVRSIMSTLRSYGEQLIQNRGKKTPIHHEFLRSGSSATVESSTSFVEHSLAPPISPAMSVAPRIFTIEDNCVSKRSKLNEPNSTPVVDLTMEEAQGSAHIVGLTMEDSQDSAHVVDLAMEDSQDSAHVIDLTMEESQDSAHVIDLTMEESQDPAQVVDLTMEEPQDSRSANAKQPASRPEAPNPNRKRVMIDLTMI